MFASIRKGQGIAAMAALAVLLPIHAGALAADPPARTTPAAGKETRVATEKPEAAETTPMTMPTVFTVPVSGLTKANLQNAKDQLSALGETRNFTFSDVALDVDRETVTFSFPESHHLRQSEMATALDKAGVKVMRDKTEVPVGSHLVLRGSNEAEAVVALQRALDRAHLFPSFKVHAGKQKDEVMLIPEMTAPAKYSALATRIRSLKTGHELADFAWVTPAAPKSAPRA